MSINNATIIPRSSTPMLTGVLRIVTGLLLLEHGTGKLFSFPDLSAMRPMMGDGLFYFTGGVELIGGLLIVVGFLTRPTAFVLSGFTAAAYFMAHLPRGFFPALNNGEAAIFFCFIFLYLAAAGPGLWAVDKE
jgi:putative oxidoreductase